ILMNFILSSEFLIQRRKKKMFCSPGKSRTTECSSALTTGIRHSLGLSPRREIASLLNCGGFSNWPCFQENWGQGWFHIQPLIFGSNPAKPPTSRL
uniref:Uncharacterized protein n=1 Tax=Ficedula albicollis TaxID=59894 RepID=A0A803W159_FICAL